MNEEFVPFELAKKLKEKGFRGEVNAYYGKWENLFDVHPALDMNDCDYRASAPTISQVLKWLREEKNLYVEVLISVRGGWYNIIYEIAPRRGFDLKHMLIEEKSYEDAAIAGIEFCLDNLI